MEPSTLSQFYDDLKSRMDAPSGAENKITRIQSDPSAGATMFSKPSDHFHMKSLKCRDKLVDDCRKHIIVDIYCHICPLDQSYIQGHQGMMKQDVDNMLAGKDMTATQYLTSAYEKTRAPLLEYLLWGTEAIGRQYMEDAVKKEKEADENGISLPEPDEVNTDNKEVAQQLVDVKQDSEYENFMDQLKAKTVKKIVTDVSKLINDKKEEQSMEFNPAASQEKLAEEDDGAVEESVFSACMDYLTRGIGPMMESVEDPDILMGLSIREATLNELDRCFQMEGSDLIRSKRRIGLGKGYIVNESACKSCVSKKENDGGDQGDGEKKEEQSDSKWEIGKKK